MAAWQSEWGGSFPVCLWGTIILDRLYGCSAGSGLQGSSPNSSVWSTWPQAPGPYGFPKHHSQLSPPPRPSITTRPSGHVLNPHPGYAHTPPAGWRLTFPAPSPTLTASFGYLSSTLFRFRSWQWLPGQGCEDKTGGAVPGPVAGPTLGFPKLPGPGINAAFVKGYFFRVQVSVWGLSSPFSSIEHPGERLPALLHGPWWISQVFLFPPNPAITEGSSQGPRRFNRSSLFPQSPTMRMKEKGEGHRMSSHPGSSLPLFRGGSHTLCPPREWCSSEPVS